ncbi:hypothetical protein WDW89_14170 [Deltaproteobacteria bacterium TL4]
MPEATTKAQMVEKLGNDIAQQIQTSGAKDQLVKELKSTFFDVTGKSSQEAIEKNLKVTKIFSDALEVIQPNDPTDDEALKELRDKQGKIATILQKKFLQTVITQVGGQNIQIVQDVVLNYKNYSKLFAKAEEDFGTLTTYALGMQTMLNQVDDWKSFLTSFSTLKELPDKINKTLNDPAYTWNDLIAEFPGQKTLIDPIIEEVKALAVAKIQSTIEAEIQLQITDPVKAQEIENAIEKLNGEFSKVILGEITWQDLYNQIPSTNHTEIQAILKPVEQVLSGSYLKNQLKFPDMETFQTDIGNIIKNGKNWNELLNTFPATQRSIFEPMVSQLNNLLPSPSQLDSDYRHIAATLISEPNGPQDWLETIEQFTDLKYFNTVKAQYQSWEGILTKITSPDVASTLSQIAESGDQLADTLEVFDHSGNSLADNLRFISNRKKDLDLFYKLAKGEPIEGQEIGDFFKRQIIERGGLTGDLLKVWDEATNGNILGTAEATAKLAASTFFTGFGASVGAALAGGPLSTLLVGYQVFKPEIDGWLEEGSEVFSEFIYDAKKIANITTFGQLSSTDETKNWNDAFKMLMGDAPLNVLYDFDEHDGHGIYGKMSFDYETKNWWEGLFKLKDNTRA